MSKCHQIMHGRQKHGPRASIRYHSSCSFCKECYEISKNRMENATLCSAGKSGQRRHKSPGCPPKSEETQAVLGRAAGREGLLGAGRHMGAPLNVLPSGIYSAEIPCLPQLHPKEWMWRGSSNPSMPCTQSTQGSSE